MLFAKSIFFWGNLSKMSNALPQEQLQEPSVAFFVKSEAEWSPAGGLFSSRSLAADRFSASVLVIVLTSP